MGYAVNSEHLESALKFVTDAYEKTTDPEMKCILMGAITAIKEKQVRDDDERKAMCDDSPCKDCQRKQCPSTSGMAVCARWRFWFRERWELTVDRILHGKKRR